MPDFETYLLHSLDDIKPSIVKDAMLYSLMAGGKRIRPQLLLATLTAYGENKETGYACAAAIEMIHTYSLIHDDLPAMDNDTLRRGKPTCHVEFDEATAILAGDALLTHAFMLVASSGYDSTIITELVKELSLYSGANGMILGQIKDLAGESKESINIDELQDIHVYKTGKLLTLPLLFAAYITKHEEDIPTWNEIGKYIGLSFQIQDDILDVTSTVEKLGKNINSDMENHKSTYVSLLGIEKAQEEANHYYDKAIALLPTVSIREEPLLEIFKQLLNRKY